MDWFVCLRSFVQVVESKSFYKAAEKQFSSSSAISRRISWLENRVGLQLLARTTRSLTLTEEGALFYEIAKKLLYDFDNLTDFAKGKKKSLSGSITLTMPLAFHAKDRFTDVLTDFLAENPAILLKLSYSNAMQDLIADNIDIAFRNSKEDVLGYNKTEVLQYQIGFYVSPGYAKNHPPIKTPMDLENHNCLVNLEAYLSTWQFKSASIYAKGNIKTDSTMALLHFAVRGVGVLRASQIAVQQEIDKGLLLPILESEWLPPVKIYLFYRDKPGTPYRIQALVEFIKARLDRNH